MVLKPFHNQKQKNMKKQLSIVALGIAMITSLSGFSQSLTNKSCLTDETAEIHFAEDPAARVRFEAIQTKLHEDMKINKMQANKAAAVVYTVPVVFHVLHAGGAENIPDATITNALAYVNRDYARTNPDASLTAVPFNTLYINSDIKFMLAHKDPSGNCTSGIVRHIDPVKMNWSQSSGNNSAYWSYTWDPTKYLNVYIVASIIPQGTVAGGGTIVGYTHLPGQYPSGDNQDAIVFVGNPYLSSDARSLSHEIGHWLSLPHIWGGTNAPAVACGNDGINDTPDTKGHLYNCPSSLSGNPCNGGGIDNVQNIMNYCSCPLNFTTDQTNAMRSTLATGGGSGRNNLWSAGNLTATDVNGTGICAPIAAFISSTNNYTVCSGGSLTMKDFSYNGTVTAWSWTGTNGANIASPVAAITSVTFPTVGQSVITLSVSNAQGSSTQSKTVTVLNGAAFISTVYATSFENPIAGGDTTKWRVVNPDGPVQWDVTSFAASTGSNSFYIEGPIDPPNQIDYLYMPTIDDTNPNDTVFTFKFAYARQSATQSDKFEVQGSKDCGGTWVTIVSLNAGQMASFSGGVTSSPFYPTASQWHLVNLYDYLLNGGSGLLGVPSMQIRFMFQEGSAGNGNRFYLDDINFSIYPVGVNELTRSIQLKLYPNPATSESFVKFTLNDAANVKVSVTDIAGKEVIPAISNNFSPGEQSISINKNNSLSKGIYFVNISLNGAKMCKKLIIQ